MALGDYLASLNLAPAVQARLRDMGEIDAPAVRDMGEIDAMGATPVAAPLTGPAAQKPWYQRALDAVGDGREPYKLEPQAPPGAAGASLDAAEVASGAPDVKGKSATELRADATLAGAPPQGPAGDDGFPTYRDLSGAPDGDAPPAPAMPMRVIPAGWQHASRGDSVQHGIDPEKLKDGQYHRDVAAGHTLLAGDKRLEGAQEQARADVAYAAEHAKASKDALAQMQRLQNEKDAYVAAEHQKLNSLNAAAQAHVDPEAAKGSHGAQLLAMIGIAMNQFGASLNGGPNTALQLVNANIDRNIAAQRDNIASAGKAADREQGLYRQNLEAFGDKERAVLATKMQYLDQAKAMADQHYAAAKSTMNEAQYHELVAGLNDKKAEVADQFGIRTEDRHTSQSHDVYRQAQVVGGPTAAGTKGKDDHFVPTLGGYARSKEDAAKLNAKGAARMQMNENMREIHALMEEGKKLSSITSPLKLQQIDAKIEGLVNDTLQASNVVAGQGAMSEGDKAVTQAARNLTKAGVQWRTDGAISRSQENIKSSADRLMKAHRFEGEAFGIQMGKEGYRRDAAGNLVPVQQLSGHNKVVTKRTESVSDLIEKPKGVSQRK